MSHLQSCTSHDQCPEGFCLKGVCHKPRFLGEQCKPGGCSEGLVCHDVLFRCVYPGYDKEGWVTKKCSSTDFCLGSEFCVVGKCVKGKKKDEACGTLRPCEDGLNCLGGTCVKRCIDAGDCEADMICEYLRGYDFRSCIIDKGPKVGSKSELEPPSQPKLKPKIQPPLPQPKPGPKIQSPPQPKPPPMVNKPSDLPLPNYFTLQLGLFVGVVVILLAILAIVLFVNFLKAKRSRAVLRQFQTYHYPPSFPRANSYGVFGVAAPPGYFESITGTDADTIKANGHQPTDEKSIEH